ncbi:glycoside hydrolase superfamily [Aspergillus insuetus]
MSRPIAKEPEYPFRDNTKSIDERVSDLLSRMTLAEKAGQLFHNMLVPGPGGSLAPEIPSFSIEDTRSLLTKKYMTHFNLLGPVEDPVMIAKWHNAVQECALSTRLGIPVTFSTDPRHHFTENVGTAFSAGTMSQWPETLGFAALRDEALVERFANIARQEYLALGLRTSLHPQVDLATEYRWARINTTFGEDAELSGKLAQAYIRGFQGPGFSHTSVSTMTKHFPGGGPQKDGEDAHFVYGREQYYPGKQEAYHLKPFEMAIAAGTRQIMPYYGMPVGTEWEEVGFAFNKGVITGILREELGFEGIIVTDWGLITDSSIMGQDMPARAWGCENLSELQRVKNILDAGCDQFGGESRPELVIQLVQDGLIPESRIDESVRRILREKFLLGLFEQPFIDPNAALIVGNPAWKAEGEAAQRRAHTLLKNDNNILPLQDLKGKRVYVEGISKDAANARGLIVVPPDQAEIAILRLRCPYEPRSGGFEAHFHAGSLAFSAEERARQAEIFSKVDVSIVDMYLDRPAVIPELASQVTALTGSYGSSEDAFLDVISGAASPEGSLPFDLPSSMEAVQESREDVPFDTTRPLFKFGHGLRYTSST